MDATLLTLDATLWGAFAFGAFVATLAYCTAYLMNFTKFSVGSVDASSGTVPARRWLLAVTALTSLALFVFSFTVFLALQVLPQGPDVTLVEAYYFNKVSHQNAAQLGRQPLTTAKVRIVSYDGFSHARVFVNNRRIFDSSVHCRFSHQCKRNGDAKPFSHVACVPWECTTTKGTPESRHLPVVFQGAAPSASAPQFPHCKLAETMADIRSCKPCAEKADCRDSWRFVNWQSGIETLDHDLPLEVDLMNVLRAGDNVLRPGENIVEVTSQNSGVGRCSLEVELILETKDGAKYPPHRFSVDGPITARIDKPGPRYGVEERREPFTTCDRQRLKLSLFDPKAP